MWLMKILVMEYLDVYCVGFLKKVPLLSLISIIPLSASNRKGGKLKNMYISVSFNL